MKSKSPLGTIIHVLIFILYSIRVLSLQMPRRSKTTLRGAAAKLAVPSLEAAKITSKCRCFPIRAEAARKGIDEALLATESPTSMQRMQTEYEAAINNLHLVLDKELDDIWSDFEGSARSALAKEI
jgi:hypothetical protein